MEPLEHHSDPRPQRAQRGRVRRRSRLEAQAGDLHRAAVEGAEAVEAAQERALAAARRADQRDGLAGAHLGVDAGQHEAAFIGFLEPADANDRRRHASFASSRAASRASG
jgi:hypothetical protein